MIRTCCGATTQVLLSTRSPTPPEWEERNPHQTKRATASSCRVIPRCKLPRRIFAMWLLRCGRGIVDERLSPLVRLYPLSRENSAAREHSWLADDTTQSRSSCSEHSRAS